MKDLAKKAVDDDDDSWHPELPIEVSVVYSNIIGEYNTESPSCDVCVKNVSRHPMRRQYITTRKSTKTTLECHFRKNGAFRFVFALLVVF